MPSLRANVASIDSLARRWDVAVEQVFVDGGSTDGTVSFIDNLPVVPGVKRIVADHPVAGIASAFNVGLGLVTCDYVLFLNADDRLEVDNWGALLEKITPSSQFVYGDIVYENTERNVKFERQAVLSDLPRYMSLFHPSLIANATVIRQLGAFDEGYKLAMDAELVHKAIHANVRFEHCPTTLAVMQLGGRSDTGFVRALWEYKRSVTQHGLQGRWRAWWYFVRQVVVQGLLKVPGVLRYRTMATPRGRK